MLLKRKSVSFGENTIHDIENISDYIRVQTFPHVLDSVLTDLSVLIDRMNDQILTLDVRKMLMKDHMKTLADYIVQNVDVTSVVIGLPYKEGGLIRDDNRTVLLNDFTQMVRMAFRMYKHESTLYNQDQTTVTFDLYPNPSLRLYIFNNDIKISDVDAA